MNFVRRLIAEGKVAKGTMKDVRVHMIADDKLMNSLSADTKLRPTTGLIGEMKKAGRHAAAGFLAKHRADIGKRGTVELAPLYDA